MPCLFQGKGAVHTVLLREDAVRWLSCLSLCVVCSVVAAVPYNGAGPGSSTINASGPGDYPSLWLALNHAASGPALTGGDWTFRIRSNLTEPTNITFNKADMNGNRIIIKPDAGTSVTVKFTSTSGRAHIAIGTTSTAENTTGYVKTDNVIIDGSNNGTNTRNLTLLTDPALATAFPVVQIVGNSDGCQVKNCTIISSVPSPVGGDSWPFTAAVQYASYYYPPTGLTNEYPDNGLVENNDITIGSFKMACGIAATQKNFLGNFDIPGAQAGLVVRNNRVSACRSAIELQNSRGADICGNTVYVKQTNDISDAYAIGIWAGKCGTTTSSEVNIYNNRIMQVHGRRGFFPISGIVVGNSATGFSYNIYNNMIGGLQQTFTFVEGVAGITITGTSANPVYANVYHNSVHIPPPPSERTGGTSSSAACVSIPRIYPAGRDCNVVVKNNVFCNEETTGVAIRRDAPGTLESDFNSFCMRKGSAADLTLWQAQSGQDANSTYASPLVANAPATGSWTSVDDHHFTADPGTLFRGTPLPAVALDIDGEARSATSPVKGADETSAQAAVESWALY
jgi:hypothetical protein